MKKSEGTKYAIFSKEFYDNWVGLARPMVCNRPMACKAGVEQIAESAGAALITRGEGLREEA
jgi:hypothetical protein